MTTRTVAEPGAEGRRGERLFLVTTTPRTLRAFFTDHARYLRDRGFEVHVVSAPGADLERFVQETGTACHPVDMMRRISPIGDVVALFKLVATFRRWRPDLVHCHTPKAGLLGTAAAWLTAVPVRVYTIHGLVHGTKRGLTRFVLRQAERLSCRLAHRVLCVSPSLLEAVVAEGICARHKAGVVRHGSVSGVDTARFQRIEATLEGAAAVRSRLGIPEDARVLGFVGRLTRDKGIVELMAAWEVLRGSDDDLYLLLVGDHEPGDPVPEATRRALASDSRVKVLGWQDDVLPFMLASTVLCLPSHREGFGVVLIEAAALEVPTVATRITGVQDAVEDEVTGLLVEAGDVAGLTDAVRRLLGDPALLRAMGKAGRERAQRLFQREMLLDGTLDEYVRLLR